MGNRESRPHPIHSRSVTGPLAELYETGTVVPVTGIYRVVHSAHRLPHEAVIIQGQRFPKCQKCAHAVLFELMHPASDLFQYKTDVVYELPEIEELDPAA